MDSLRPVLDFRKRPLRFAALSVFLLSSLYIFDHTKNNAASVYSQPELSSEVQDACPNIPDDMIVIVKTGATEAAGKIPTLMRTALRCIKEANVLLFSDLEQDIESYHLYDALESIDPSVKVSNPGFVFYEKLKIASQTDGNFTNLQAMRDPTSPSDLAAWSLDKYKNMHMLEKTFELRPNKPWYVFIDADTYIAWPNLVRYLQGQDPNRRAFYGSRVYLGPDPFVHGGSGFVISGSALHDFAVTHQGTAAKWDPKVHAVCCGDFLMSQALLEYGNELISVRPFFSGQKPSTIPYSNVYWCQPVFSMHHVQPYDHDELNAFERSRENKSMPITYAEIFEVLVKDALDSTPSPREDWDNISWKVELGSALTGDESELFEVASVEACSVACDQDTDCVQYLFDGHDCQLGKAARRGESRPPEEGKKWYSGWHKERIAKWYSEQMPCTDVDFPP